jgi:hypothetical protein
MKYKVKVYRTEAAVGWKATVPGVDPGVVVHDVERPAAVRRAQAEALRVIAARVEKGEIGPFENAVLLMCFTVRDGDADETESGRIAAAIEAARRERG